MKISKKQEIIDAAINLFAEKGISNVSVYQIAREINATKGTVYYYFKKGKNEIVAEILKGYEKYIESCIPDKTKWVCPQVNAKDILFNLFFNFPPEEMMKLRKIIRIIMSGMYQDKQIAKYAEHYLINGREELLADCFNTLVVSKKIAPLDAESAARFLNRLLLVYAIEDALLYPYIDNIDIAEVQNKKTMHDCTNLMNYILSSRDC